MAANRAANPLEPLAIRWSNLADRRLAYYVELYESGRWQKYFTAQEFLDRLRDVKYAARAWDDLAGGAAHRQRITT